MYGYLHAFTSKHIEDAQGCANRLACFWEPFPIIKWGIYSVSSSKGKVKNKEVNYFSVKNKSKCHNKLGTALRFNSLDRVSSHLHVQHLRHLSCISLARLQLLIARSRKPIQHNNPGENQERGCWDAWSKNVYGLLQEWNSKNEQTQHSRAIVRVKQNMM